MKSEKIIKKKSSQQSQKSAPINISKYKDLIIPGVFVDPKNDVALKKLFGDINHKSVTMAFLNSMLNLSGDKEITNIDFLKTEELPDHLFGKKYM